MIEVARLSTLVDADTSPHEIGNKAANLVTLARLGLPVPEALIVSARISAAWRDNDRRLPGPIAETLRAELAQLAGDTGRVLGDAGRVLLVSVRSGAEVSMPGLMSTQLNVGIAPSMARRWAADASVDQAFRARLYQRMVGDFLDGDDERERLAEISQRPAADRLLALAELAESAGLPSEPADQVLAAVSRVMASWESPGARSYRRTHDISDELGTAVVVQRMVFGNIDGQSASGLVATRNPDTGAPGLSGGFLLSSQGPDVVGADGPSQLIPIAELREHMPTVMDELERCARAIDDHYSWPQDLEFTIESGRLWLLQARRAPLDPSALIRIAVDLVREGRLTPEEAVAQAPPTAALDARQDCFSAQAIARATDAGHLLVHGLAAAPGLATGPLVCGPEQAQAGAIVVCDMLDPVEHFAAIENAGALVTARGGTGSHTATLARLFGRPYITGCADLEIDESGARFGKKHVPAGTMVSLDGQGGRLFLGELEREHRPPPPELAQFATWQDEYLPKSRWRVAAYRDRSKPPTDHLSHAREIVSRAPWKTAKAVAVELVAGIIPEPLRIPQFVCHPHDQDRLRERMLAGLERGRWIGLRPCYSVRSFGRGTWQMALSTADQVEGFLRDPDFKGPVKDGGYPSWIENKDLEEIVVVWDPPQKGLKEFADRQFALSISCMAASVGIELVLGTAQVRYLEQARANRLIHLRMEVDHNVPQARGRRRARYGSDYLLDPQDSEQIEIELDWNGPLDPRVNELSQTVARNVAHAVFHSWWASPVELPHRMCALDDAYGLSALEFQGQFASDGSIEYMELFDVKGAEERGFLAQKADTNEQ